MFVESVLKEICLYLDAKTTFLEVCLINKSVNETINTQTYQSYWIRSYFKIPLEISESFTKNLYKNTCKNKILNFSAWKTDGGVSRFEGHNTYENMWNYNGTSFSTYYNFHLNLPLRKNINCLASFGGGFQSKKGFLNFFHNDLYHLATNGLIPEEYKIDGKSLEKCFVLNPLNQVSYPSVDDLPYQDIDLQFMNTSIECQYILPWKKCKDLPIVTKIALARPYFFTGVVKTLMFIVSDSYSYVDFPEFDRFNNITDAESAENLGNAAKIVETDEFRYVEFNRGTGFYPLMWFQFKSCFHNHFVIQLTQAHFSRTCCVKLIEIDDRREIYGLMNAQPNFDITYTLLIGDILVLD